MSSNALACPSCGCPTMNATPIKKSKTTAIILAILLGQWTWLYTYRQDSDKFWFGMIICFFGIFLLFIPNVIVWIWTMIDTINKPIEWYENYSNV